MRSKILLASNIVASIYCVLLSWALIGTAIINSGGEGIINAVGGFFESVFEIVGVYLAITNYLYVLAILLLVHIGFVVVGCIISWIAYVTKKDSVATASAIVYLVGAVCSPLCFIFGIAVSAFAFVGANDQRQLNKIKGH